MAFEKTNIIQGTQILWFIQENEMNISRRANSVDDTFKGHD